MQIFMPFIVVQISFVMSVNRLIAYVSVTNNHGM